MIESSPERVERRQGLSHYEGGTDYGAMLERTWLVTLVARSTGLVLVGTSRDRTVKSVNRALSRLPDDSPLPASTLDNGREFDGYQEVEVATGIQIDFARPH